MPSAVVNVDVHRAFGMGVGGIAIDARHQFDRPGEFEIRKRSALLVCSGRSGA
jgi:hypothetical protein